MTAAQTPPLVHCPPSSVVDQIVTWSEVQEGDLVLINEGFAVALKVRTFEDDWQGHKWMRTDVRYQQEDGGVYETAEWADRYTAVRRYDISEEQDR